MLIEVIHSTRPPVHCHMQASDRVQVPRRFAILQSGSNPPSLLEKYGDKHTMFKHWLEDLANNETWDTYNVYLGEFPSEDATCQYDAFVISGSKYDAHGTEPWIVQLKELVRRLYCEKRRVLAVCFGHQLVSLALGGHSERAQVGWELGVREIVLNPHFLQAHPGLAPTHLMLQSHQDQVSRLPADALLLASSARCPIEMYQAPAQSPVFLCTQFHPEYSPEFVRELCQLRVVDGHSKEILDTFIRSDNRELSSSALKNALKSFLKAPLHSSSSSITSQRDPCPPLLNTVPSPLPTPQPADQ